VIKLYVKELEAVQDNLVPVTASVVCKEGEYQDIGVVIGGDLVPSQTNILARHDDGSIRHALVTFHIATVGQVDTVHTVTLDPNQSQDAERFPLPKMDFDDLAAKVEVTDTNGGVWIADIPSAFGWPIVRVAGTSDRFSPRLKGPLGEEVEWRQPLKGLSGDHPQLTASFRWRLYDRAKGARIEVVLENAAYPDMEDVDTRSIKISMANREVLSLSNKMIYAGQRMREVNWVGQAPAKVLVQQDATY
jgi:hypothetical protein